jgi:dUTP pyrophosphatase
METAAVQFKKLDPGAIIPTRATTFSAGFDLYALKDMKIVGGAGTYIVPTGIAVQLPLGTYGRIAMRSGLAVNQHLCVSAGVIDVDYIGAIGVVVYCAKSVAVSDRLSISGDGNPEVLNRSHVYTIHKGDRIAQLIIENVSMAPGIEVTQFSREHAAHLGFGSTGVNATIVPDVENKLHQRIIPIPIPESFD